MKNITRWIPVVLVVAAAGCGKSHHADGVPCDSKAVAALESKLSKANGIGVDLTNDSLKADIATAKKELAGKQFAFDGCKFESQGNDVVTFAASDSGTSIDCAMKDGAAGVKNFRQAAMKIGQEKVRLDVSGVIASHGDKDFERLGMVDCEISTHE